MEPSNFNDFTFFDDAKKNARHCFYCTVLLGHHKQATKPTFDHVIPASKGGKKSPENIVIACFKCNQEKGQLTGEEFIQVIRFRQWKQKEAEAKKCVATVHIPSELQNLTYEDHVFLYKAGVSCD